MVDSANAIQEALSKEAESSDVIDAAEAENQRGELSLSLGLLREAIAKERSALDLMGQGIESLQQSLESRRQALEQQEEVLAEMIETTTDKS